MFENIALEMDEGIAVLTIDRPDKMNAVNNATVEEIDQALAEIEKQPDVRVLVLTGSGDKAFVAGADIREVEKRDTLLGRTETRRRQEVYTRIENLEISSIAAVNGWALGTGLELAVTLVSRPKIALQYAKESVLRYSEGSLNEGLAHESYLHALACGTQDKKEGVAAFLEKRDPRFIGK